MSLGCVYFIGCAELGAVKIGYSAGDPRRRLQSFQIGSAARLEVLDSVQGLPITEAKFHRAFAALRIGGEWFRLEGKLRDFLYFIASRQSDDFVDDAIEDVLDGHSPMHPGEPLSLAEYRASGSAAPFSAGRFL